MALSQKHLSNYSMNPYKTKVSYPVSLAEAKDQVREETNDNNTRIDRAIHTATSEAESLLGLDLAKTKAVLTKYDFSGDTIVISLMSFWVKYSPKILTAYKWSKGISKNP